MVSLQLLLQDLPVFRGEDIKAQVIPISVSERVNPEQLGKALMLYLQDWDEYFPRASMRTTLPGPVWVFPDPDVPIRYLPERGMSKMRKSIYAPLTPRRSLE